MSALLESGSLMKNTVYFCLPNEYPWKRKINLMLVFLNKTIPRARAVNEHIDVIRDDEEAY